MLNRFKRNWDYALLQIVLDVILQVKEAPTWAFVVLAVCVAILVGIREFDHITKSNREDVPS